jgi:hypothetical protein
MGNKKLYKVEFRVVFISDTPIKEDENLIDLLEDDETINRRVLTKNVELVGKPAVIEVEKCGSEAEYFGMDAQGFEIEY